MSDIPVFDMLQAMAVRDGTRLYRRFSELAGREMWCCEFTTPLPRSMGQVSGWHTYQYYDDSAEEAVKSAYAKWCSHDWKTS